MVWYCINSYPGEHCVTLLRYRDCDGRWYARTVQSRTDLPIQRSLCQFNGNSVDISDKLAKKSRSDDPITFFSFRHHHFKFLKWLPAKISNDKNVVINIRLWRHHTGKIKDILMISFLFFAISRSRTNHHSVYLTFVTVAQRAGCWTPRGPFFWAIVVVVMVMNAPVCEAEKKIKK